MPRGENAGFLLAVGDDGGRDYDTLLGAVASIDIDVVTRSHRRLPADYSRVRLIAEHAPISELRQLYADAAFVVVPLHDRPHAGGISAVLEAAAMSRGMIVSDSAGVCDCCVDGETCLLAPCGDVATLAAAIRRLAADPELRERLGRNARAFAKRECLTEAFAARLAARLRAADRAGCSSA